MSRTINSYTINHSFTTTNKATNLKGLIEKIVNSNERLSMREVENADLLCDYRFKYSSAPNLEVSFRAVSSEAFASARLFLIDPETTTDIKSNLIMSTQASHLAVNDIVENVIINVVEIDNVAIYVHIATKGRSKCAFMFSPFVNYFTNERTNGIIWFTWGGSGSGGSDAYTEKNIASTIAKVNIGGDSYPGGNSIATQRFFASSSANFYGYVVDPEFLYTIWNGSSSFAPDSAMFRTSLGGYTFTHLGAGLFARLD